MIPRIAVFESCIALFAPRIEVVLGIYPTYSRANSGRLSVHLMVPSENE